MPLFYISTRRHSHDQVKNAWKIKDIYFFQGEGEVELQRVEKTQFIPGNKPGFLGRKF